MSNYKTTIGGAISTLGSGLIGLGLLPQFSSTIGADEKAILWYLALAGYIINMVGKSLTSLFAADASEVARIKDQVNANTAAIPTSGNNPVVLP